MQTQGRKHTHARPHTTPIGPRACGGELTVARPVRVDMYVRVCACVLGLDRLRFHTFCLFHPSTPALRCLGFITRGCPGASVSVVCALCGSLSRPRRVQCWRVCDWCLGGTGCGVICVVCVDFNLWDQ